MFDVNILDILRGFGLSHRKILTGHFTGSFLSRIHHWPTLYESVWLFAIETPGAVPSRSVVLI